MDGEEPHLVSSAPEQPRSGFHHIPTGEGTRTRTPSAPAGPRREGLTARDAALYQRDHDHVKYLATMSRFRCDEDQIVSSWSSNEFEPDYKQPDSSQMLISSPEH